MVRFVVADASEYLAITGCGIKGVKLAKKSLVFEGQDCKKFSIAPVTYSFEVKAMSREQQHFILPAVFTIGPQVTTSKLSKAERREVKARLFRYVEIMPLLDRSPDDLPELVKGVIEGETRVLTAELKMEEILKDTNTYKQMLLGHLEKELNHVGLHIYNANVKQPLDVQRQKMQQDPASQARVDGAAAVGGLPVQGRHGHQLITFCCTRVSF